MSQKCTLADVRSFMEHVRNNYFERFQVSDNWVRMWHRALAIYTRDHLRQAFFQHCQSSRFVPSLSDIKGQCESIAGRKDYQAVSCSQRDSRETSRMKRELKLVPTFDVDRTTDRWLPAEYVTTYKGVPRHKIELLMDFFGPAEVTERLKRLVGVADENQAPWSKLMASAEWVPKYLKAVNHMVAEMHAIEAGDDSFYEQEINL